MMDNYHSSRNAGVYLLIDVALFTIALALMVVGMI